MSTINQAILAGMISLCLALPTAAQEKAKISIMKDHELAVLNELASPSVVVNMPVSQLLNAPGNEALRAFFFTPVKDTTVLKGKKIAVLAADGFEEIELLGPVWYLKQLGAKVDIVAPKFNPAPERYGLMYPEMSKTHIMAIQYLLPVGWVKFDRTADQVKVGDYDGVFIPSGAWNPDNLRNDKDVIRVIQDLIRQAS